MLQSTGHSISDTDLLRLAADLEPVVAVVV